MSGWSGLVCLSLCIWKRIIVKIIVVIVIIIIMIIIITIIVIMQSRNEQHFKKGTWFHGGDTREG